MFIFVTQTIVSMAVSISTTSSATIEKPRLSIGQLLNMSFGFFGIQFGFALQNANVSRIFQTLGADLDKIAILWIAAPFTGLLIQPIIGYMSDRTWHPFWGRRRIFFFVGAILASAALLLMPNSSALWMAALLLWVLDASINISMEPFRAFVGDKLPASQRTSGFAMQTFFIGLGAVIASLLPYIFTNYFHIANTAAAGIIPPSVKYSFYIGGCIFLAAVMWTVFTSKEYPPDDMQAFEEEKQKGKGISHIFTEIISGIGSMPRTMKQLAVVQFFTWLAFFSMWIYTTPGVAQNVYGTTDTTSKAFQDAGDWVGVMFMVYNGVSALAAFLLPVLAAKISRRYTHMICLILGGIGLISLFFIRDSHTLLFSMALIGLAWASTLTMPYAILAGALPASKMGFYMGVFNFFIVIPQILAAAILGFFVKHVFNDQSIYALLVGGISMIIAGFLNVIVKEPRNETATEITTDIEQLSNPVQL